MTGEAALQGLFQIGAPLIHGGARGAGFIAEIVAVAHEGVDGAHGLALLRREQDERVVEVLGAGARHLQAVLIRLVDGDHQSAREENATRATLPSKSPTRSTLEIAGRAPRDRKSTRLNSSHLG